MDIDEVVRPDALPFPDLRSLPSDTAGLAAARTALPETVTVALDGIGQGLHPGIQVHVGHRGTTVASFGAGWARHDLPMTERTRTTWACSNKPLVAAVFMVLWDQGAVGLDDPVCSVVPGFGVHGKELITFRHLLTHTTGVQPDPWYSAMWGSREECREAISGVVLDPAARPGTKAYYAQFWAWQVLVDAIEALSGVEWEDYARKAVLEPIGVDDYLTCIPVEDLEERWADVGLLYDTASSPPTVLKLQATPDRFAVWAPGVNGGGSARSLARVMELLMPERDGACRAVLSESAREVMISRHRVGLFDPHWDGYLSWGLGLVVDGWVFGAEPSDRTFGHTGLNTSFCFGDPETGLVVACIANGMLDVRAANERKRDLVAAIHRDLGIDAVGSSQILSVVGPHEAVDAARDRAALEMRYWKPGRSQGDARLGDTINAIKDGDDG